MNRNMRSRRRKKHIEKTRVNLSSIIVIIVMAVTLGFLTTKFIIYPIILGEDAKIGFSITKLLHPLNRGEVSEPNKKAYIASDGAIKPDNPISGGGVDSSISNSAVMDRNTNIDAGKSTNTGSTVTGYCIQFGSFTTRGAAQELISQLTVNGINATIQEKDGAFKVIGDLFPTKAAAVDAKNKIVLQQYSDVFVTFI